jgi:hypothetical protein
LAEASTAPFCGFLRITLLSDDINQFGSADYSFDGYYIASWLFVAVTGYRCCPQKGPNFSSFADW